MSWVAVRLLLIAALLLGCRPEPSGLSTDLPYIVCPGYNVVLYEGLRECRRASTCNVSDVVRDILGIAERECYGSNQCLGSVKEETAGSFVWKCVPMVQSDGH
jgi:hypothetical protein